MKPKFLVEQVSGFFHHLSAHGGISNNTITSYTDAWNIFIRFLARETRRPIERLTADVITESVVETFLSWLEADRRISVKTRNCRLAAIKGLARFVFKDFPTAFPNLFAVARIPTKKAGTEEPHHLQADEVRVLLLQPNKRTVLGRRDYTLLTLLVETGARIQEALDITASSINLDVQPWIKLNGKGGKVRTLPISANMVSLFRPLVSANPDDRATPIFRNRHGNKLTASGVRHKLRRYASAASEALHSLPAQAITPHVFRHTFGVLNIEAGVDQTTIRNTLGHASLQMTAHYARASMKTKREALAKAECARQLPVDDQDEPVNLEMITWLRRYDKPS